MSPAKLATTPPVSVPALSVVAVDVVRVATPLLLVTAVPTEVPSSVKLTVSPDIPALVTDDVSVADSIAVATDRTRFPRRCPAWWPAWPTAKSPVASLEMYVMSPAKLATIAPVSVPAASLVTTPVSVATPSLLVKAWPANDPSSVKSTVSPEIAAPVACGD